MIRDLCHGTALSSGGAFEHIPWTLGREIAGGGTLRCRDRPQSLLFYGFPGLHPVTSLGQQFVLIGEYNGSPQRVSSIGQLLRQSGP